MHQPQLLPASYDEMIEPGHLVRVVNDAIDKLDLSVLVAQYKGGGTSSYHPQMLLKVLVYAYCKKIYASRKIAEAMRTASSARAIGTEAARLLGSRIDPLETPEQRTSRIITEAIMSPTPKEKARIESETKEWSDSGNGNTDTMPPTKTEKKVASRAKKIKEQLKRQGFDIDNPESFKDRDAALRALAEINAAKATKIDAAYEFWRNAILSAPKTAITNTSAILNIGWDFTAKWTGPAIDSMSGLRKG